MHEVGHALYELQVNPIFSESSLGGGASCALHESQSRFYENVIGRSKEFIEFLYPILKDLFKEELKDYTFDDIYYYINDVSNQFTNLGNGSRVFAYLDPTSAFNSQGVPNISYVYYNPNSSTKYSDNLSGLTRNLYGSTNDITTSNYISGQEIGNGRKKRRCALHGELNIPGSDNSILADEEGNLYLGK